MNTNTNRFGGYTAREYNYLFTNENLTAVASGSNLEGDATLIGAPSMCYGEITQNVLPYRTTDLLTGKTIVITGWTMFVEGGVCANASRIKKDGTPAKGNATSTTSKIPANVLEALTAFRKEVRGY